MTYENARTWLVVSSFVMLGISGIFFISAPVFHFPLKYSQAIQLLQMIFPLFLGYLSAAVVFIFDGVTAQENLPLKGIFPVLVRGPFLLASALLVIATIAFGYSNWIGSGKIDLNGMPFDVFANLIALILGIHTSITNALVAYLFKRGKHNA